MPPRSGLNVFGSDTLQDMGLGLPSRPNQSFAPGLAQVGLSNLSTAPVGVGLDQSRIDSMLAEIAPRMPQQTAQVAARPRAMFSQSTGRLWVNGFEFNENDAAQALQSEQYFSAPPAASGPETQAQDWRPLSDEEYQNYISEIRNPSVARRAGEAFQMGMRGLGQSYAGAVLLADPNNQWAREQVATIQGGMERDAPYIQNWDDVQDAGDLAVFAMQSGIQVVPWVVDAIAWGIAGAAIGTAVAPGAGTLAGAAQSQGFRAMARRMALDAAEQLAVFRRLPVARQAEIMAARGAGGYEELYTATRAMQQARGAMVATAGSNYATSSGDVFVNLLQNGADPNDPAARGSALLAGIPYAAGETLSDAVGGSIAMGFARAGMSRSRWARAFQGMAVSAPVEGATEAGQQGIIEGTVNQYTGQPWSDADTRSVVGSGAAGLFGGLLMGGVAGGVSPGPRQDQPTNLLDGGTPAPTVPQEPYAEPQGGFTPQMPWPMGEPVTTPDSFAGLQVPIPTSPQGAYTPNQDVNPQALLAQTENTPPPTGGVYAELNRLRERIVDPNATPEQREAARQAFETLSRQNVEGPAEGGIYNRMSAERGANPLQTTPIENLPYTPLVRQELEPGIFGQAQTEQSTESAPIENTITPKQVKSDAAIEDDIRTNRLREIVERGRNQVPLVRSEGKLGPIPSTAGADKAAALPPAPKQNLPPLTVPEGKMLMDLYAADLNKKLSTISAAYLKRGLDLVNRAIANLPPGSKEIKPYMALRERLENELKTRPQEQQTQPEQESRGARRQKRKRRDKSNKKTAKSQSEADEQNRQAAAKKVENRRKRIEVLKARIKMLDMLRQTGEISKGQEKSLRDFRRELRNLEDKLPENAGTTRLGTSNIRYTKSEETTNAVREQSADAATAGETPGGSKEVGGEVRNAEKSAGTQGKKEAPAQGSEEEVTGPAQEAPPPSAAFALKKAEFDKLPRGTAFSKAKGTLGSYSRHKKDKSEVINGLNYDEWAALAKLYENAPREPKTQEGAAQQSLRAEATMRRKLATALSAPRAADRAKLAISAMLEDMPAAKKVVKGWRKADDNNDKAFLEAMFGRANDSTGGKFSTSGDGGNVIGESRLKAKMAIDRVTKIVDNIHKFIKLDHKVTIVADIADLKKRFPQLYTQALNAFVGGREAFVEISQVARAYGWQGNIVLFANNIEPGFEAREYIHEMLHFGLRNLFNKLDTLSPSRAKELRDRLGFDFFVNDLVENLTEEEKARLSKDGYGSFSVILEWLYIRNSDVKARAGALMRQFGYEHEQAIEEAVVEFLAARADNLMLSARNKSVWEKFIGAIHKIMVFIEDVAYGYLPTLGRTKPEDIKRANKLSEQYMNFMLYEVAKAQLTDKYAVELKTIVGAEFMDRFATIKKNITLGRLPTRSLLESVSNEDEGWTLPENIADMVDVSAPAVGVEVTHGYAVAPIGDNDNWSVEQELFDPGPQPGQFAGPGRPGKPPKLIVEARRLIDEHWDVMIPDGRTVKEGSYDPEKTPIRADLAERLVAGGFAKNMETAQVALSRAYKDKVSGVASYVTSPTETTVVSYAKELLEANWDRLTHDARKAPGYDPSKNPSRYTLAQQLVTEGKASSLISATTAMQRAYDIIVKERGASKSSADGRYKRIEGLFREYWDRIDHDNFFSSDIPAGSPENPTYRFIRSQMLSAYPEMADQQGARTDRLRAIMRDVYRKIKAEKQSGHFSTSAAVDPLSGLLGTGQNFRPPSGEYRLEDLQRLATTTGMADAARKLGEGVRNAATRYIRTMSDWAEDSPLASFVMRIIWDTQEAARTYQNKYSRMIEGALHASELNPLRRLVGQREKGLSVGQINTLAEMLYANRLHLVGVVKDEEVARANITYAPDGSIDYAATKEALVRRVSIEDFRNGFTTHVVHSNGKRTPGGEFKYDGADLEQLYEVFSKYVDALAESQLDYLGMLLAAAERDRQALINKVTDTISGTTSETKTFVNAVHKLYESLSLDELDAYSYGKQEKAQRQADQVLSSLFKAVRNEKVREYWLDQTKMPPKNGAKVDKSSEIYIPSEYRGRPEFAAVVEMLQKQKDGTASIVLEEGKSKSLTATLGNIIGLRQHTIRQAERDAASALMRAFVPLKREGTYRVALTALDSEGNEVRLAEEVRNVLPAFHVENDAKAEELAKALNAEFDQSYEITDASGAPATVTFTARYEKFSGAKGTARLPTMQQFLEVTDLLGWSIAPNNRNKIANMLANEESRFGLMQTGTPGFIKDIAPINDHLINGMAWAVAYAATRPRKLVNEALTNPELIYGSVKHLAKLQEEHNKSLEKPANARAAEIHRTGKALAQYARMLSMSMKKDLRSPTLSITLHTPDGKTKVETFRKHGRGDAARVEMQKLFNEMIAKEGDLQHLQDDWISKNGWLRVVTGAFMLGGSPASAFVNATGVVTLLPTYLAYINRKTGFGLGAGMARSTAAVSRAIAEVWGNLPGGILDQDKLEAAIAEGRSIGGVDTNKLKFLLYELVHGALNAVSLENISGGAEKRVGNALIQGIFKAWMSPFATVEEGNRAVTMLAARDIIMEQMIASGEATLEQLNDTKSEQFRLMSRRAKDVLTNTQFDYSNANRAAIFRGTLGNYIYMFRHFPVSMTQIIYRLPPQGQLAILAMLFIMGGLKGEPFAEDIMDLYDTLLQRLGFKHNSVELQIAQLADSVLPGSAPFILRGAIDQIFMGGTFSSRASMGDIIPMTGALRYGADFGRELQTAFGPVWSNVTASSEWAMTIASYAAGVAGLRDQTTSFADVVRTTPIAGLRGPGEAWLMAQDGQITDRQGRLISDNVTLGAIFMRALGFYPVEATRANDSVRLSRYHDGFMRNLRAQYTLAWANAYRTGDSDAMNRIQQDVMEWNEAARNSGREDMVINNFLRSARRAGEAADRVLTERKSETDTASAITDEIARILLADEETN